MTNTQNENNDIEIMSTKITMKDTSPSIASYYQFVTELLNQYLLFPDADQFVWCIKNMIVMYLNMIQVNGITGNKFGNEGILAALTRIAMDLKIGIKYGLEGFIVSHHIEYNSHKSEQNVINFLIEELDLKDLNDYGVQRMISLITCYSVNI